MKKISALLLCSLLGAFTLAACNSTSGTVLPESSPTPQATAATKRLPESIFMGQSVVYKDLQVTMDQSEITASYITEYGSSREPSADSKFLWVHIILKNISGQEQDLPAAEHFSAIFDATEFKPSYGHRKDHTNYTSLNAVIVQGEEVGAWLRFDIPSNAESKDLTFAFLPESTQVSFGFSSNDYSWADHPIFLWMCAP